jgi:hypothetical protein
MSPNDKNRLHKIIKNNKKLSKNKKYKVENINWFFFYKKKMVLSFSVIFKFFIFFFVFFFFEFMRTFCLIEKFYGHFCLFVGLRDIDIFW